MPKGYLTRTMKLEKIIIDTSDQPESSVLIIYTGGTMGMGQDKSGDLVSFNFQEILDRIPSLKTMNLRLTVISFTEPLDSSNIKPVHWVQIAHIIYDNYQRPDGFVILHGTDTIAYSASALSFILDGLNKPVIFTGAQLPISSIRSDGRENLITAIELASARENGVSIVPEVSIFFDNILLRGNRSKKVESILFDAFKSENYPHLAQSGVEIEYNRSFIQSYSTNNKLKIIKDLDLNVALIKLFPGISENVIGNTLSTPGLKGLILETFGSGNAPSEPWLIDCLKNAIEKDIMIMNVSQCDGGKVLQGKYDTSRALQEIGILSGKDITTESAITKMMVVLGFELGPKEKKEILITPMCGEMK